MLATIPTWRSATLAVLNPVTASDLTVMNLLGWDSTSQSAPPAITAAPAQGHDSAGGTVSVSAANGVLANVTDINSNGSLTVSSVNGSSADVGVAVAGDFGALTLNADGSYTYVNSNPGAVTSAHGVAEDTFNFTISDGQGDTASSSLTVLITSANEALLTGTSNSTVNRRKRPNRARWQCRQHDARCRLRVVRRCTADQATRWLAATVETISFSRPISATRPSTTFTPETKISIITTNISTKRPT